MPIYEFVCSDCHKEFEVLVRDQHPVQCETCGGAHVTRLLSVPAAPSKGSAGGPCEMPQLSPCGRGGCGLPQCDS